MASKKVVGLHEAALEEARAAYDWYATRNPAAAEAFIDELDHAMKQIGVFTEAGSSHISGTRRQRRFENGGLASGGQLSRRTTEKRCRSVRTQEPGP